MDQASLKDIEFMAVGLPARQSGDGLAMDGGDGCPLNVVDSVLNLADGFECVGDFQC